jgi:hypothetical protein
MAVTTNFGWSTPDNTDLVKDGASAIRTLGNSIDSSFVDLKGGTTGQVLYKSSNTDLDFGWTSAAASNWSLLNAGGTTLTGAATITVSGISGADKIFVLFRNATAGSGSIITFRFNADSGANYSQAGFQNQLAAAYAAGNFGGYEANGQTAYRVAGLSGAAAPVGHGYISLTGANAAGVKVVTSAAGGTAGGASNHLELSTAGIWNNAAAITSVSIISSAGNFTAGTIFVYVSA